MWGTNTREPGVSAHQTSCFSIEPNLSLSLHFWEQGSISRLCLCPWAGKLMYTPQQFHITINPAPSPTLAPCGSRRMTEALKRECPQAAISAWHMGQSATRGICLGLMDKKSLQLPWLWPWLFFFPWNREGGKYFSQIPRRVCYLRYKMYRI